MSKSKKPGTDLAALKARLAKKKQKAEPAPPPAAAPAAAQPLPAPGLPAPGQPAPQYQAPPEPQYQAAPPADLPAPGQPAPHYQAPPQYEAPAQPQHQAAAPAAAVDPDDPFGGGGGTFDPTDGVIDTGGEVASGKSPIGLMIFVALLGAALGGVGGFLVQDIVQKGKAKTIATVKGAEMVEGVAGVISARKDVSLALEAIEKKMVTDPAGAAADIDTLVKEKYDKQIKLDNMFGWQLASINQKGVRRTFELYEESTRLKKDLQYLSAFMTSQADALKAGGGPSSFAVTFKSNGVKLVAALAPMCGGEEPEAPLAPCAADKRADAKGYKILDAVGGEPKVILRGVGEGQGMLVLADGGVYAYAVGGEPNRNAIIVRNGLLQRVKEHLESMAKSEKIAAKSLENYVADPTLDGSSAQPDPEAAE